MPIIKQIYVGTNRVRPSYYDYTPNSNTLAYYPMKENLNDYSGNGRNLSGTATFSNNKMTNTSAVTRSQIFSGTVGAFTVSFWTRGGDTGGINENDSGGPERFLTAKGLNSDTYNGNAIIGNSRRRSGGTTILGTNSDFFLLTFVYNGSTFKAYQNGVNFGTNTSCSGNLKTSSTSFRVGAGVWGQIIVEKGAWSATEISNYYNSSKGNYGIS